MRKILERETKKNNQKILIVLGIVVVVVLLAFLFRSRFTGEVVGAPSPTPTVTTARVAGSPAFNYDVNRDRRVNFADVHALLGNLLNNQKADFNGDGAVNVKDVIDEINKLFGFTAPSPAIPTICPTMKDDDCTVTGSGVSEGEGASRAEAEQKAVSDCNQKSLSSCQDSQDRELNDNQQSCENSPAGCGFSSQLKSKECEIQSCASIRVYMVYGRDEHTRAPNAQGIIHIDKEECDHAGNCKVTFLVWGEPPDGLKNPRTWFECIAVKQYNQDAYTCEKQQEGAEDCTAGGVC